MYSRYEGKGNGSSVYMVKTGVRRVLANYPDCYDYTSGITGDDTSDHITYEPTAEALAEMKLTPYTGLDSEPLIRYLYTGREYNIETGDYYYRYRMMEAGIGRFTSKDPLDLMDNLYIYATNTPVMNIDPKGLSSSTSVWSFIFTHSVVALRAYNLKKAIPGGDEKSNTLRHCNGACELYQEYGKLGEDAMNANENPYSSGIDTRVDCYNNMVGIQLAKDNPIGNCSILCNRAWTNNKLAGALDE